LSTAGPSSTTNSIDDTARQPALPDVRNAPQPLVRGDDQSGTK